jgi:hypothetical protein
MKSMTKHTLSDLQKLAETDEGRERIRVLVAELMGWTGIYEEVHPAITYLWGYDDEFEHPKHRRIVPDYPRDLNAIASAEAGLTDEEHAAFQGLLILVCEGKRTVSASALHRCMAFILTKQPTKGDE